ncbi:MAG: hypothetical protein LBJ13_00610 [Puniceicoccales bacterium]|jgi:hypothetical protein|nr:hypothetical protein [Puniceicoccales bacterium]
MPMKEIAMNELLRIGNENKKFGIFGAINGTWKKLIQFDIAKNTFDDKLDCNGSGN